MSNFNELFSNFGYPEKVIPHMARWINNFIRYSQKKNLMIEDPDALQSYINFIERTNEPWRVNQAEEAVKIYLFSNFEMLSISNSTDAKQVWRESYEIGIKLLRIKHYAHNTEKCYVAWWRQFYVYTSGINPNELDTNHFKNFLTHLALERKVSAATQNQALNAILFLYKNCLQKDPGDLTKSLRAKRRRHIPVVLTKEEISRVFSQMKGTELLMAQIIYGSGMRNNECHNLRIKDIDFDRAIITVRCTKGGDQRNTVLPKSIITNLKEHLERVRIVFNEEGYGSEKE